MNTANDTKALKKPANLSVNSDLLSRAKGLKINISATLDAALRQAVQAKEGELWKQENEAGIQAYNKYLDKHGLFNEGMRKF